MGTKVIIKLFILLSTVVCTASCGYNKFAGTYEADLTLMQSGKTTTIVVNRDGTGYFKEGNSHEMVLWWPADNGGGIQFSSNGVASPEKGGYFMNKKRTKMYWGIDDYMNDQNGYKVKKVK